jgi:hypothetical protein
MNQGRREPLSRRTEAPKVIATVFAWNDNRCGKQQPWRRARSLVEGIVTHTLFGADYALLGQEYLAQL